MYRRSVTKSISGPPVPKKGYAIPDLTLGYMLDEAVIGWSPNVRVYTTMEAQFFLKIGLDNGNHLTATALDQHVECLPLVQRDPSAHHLFMAVGVAYGKGGLALKGDGDVCEGVGDHFVCLYVDTVKAQAYLVDSLPSAGVTQYFFDVMPHLSTSIYGNNSKQLTLCQLPCVLQAPGSNDCAVHVWRFIADRLTCFHDVPAFGNVLVDPEDICRDVFRTIFYSFNS